MKPASLTWLILALGNASLEADQLTLKGGDKLTGSILDMDGQGRVTFETTNAAAPLQLRGAALDSVFFEFENPNVVAQSERVTLHNGDVFPGEVISLNSETLSLHTWACGDLQIPRSAIASVAFGVTPHNLVFQGPEGEAGWINSENWEFTGKTLTSSKRGIIARKNVLPEQFILRFKVAWATNPNFRFYFCDDYLQRNGDTNRYYFEINTSGIKLKRQAAGSKNHHWSPLFASERRPDSFPEQFMEVELRIDRRGRMIHVYINGEPEDSLDDPIGDIPTGNGIMLESLAGGDMKNIVSSIEIYEWDAVSQIHRNEGHKDVKTDAVVTTESERYEGIVERLDGEGPGRGVLIDSPHADELVRIPFSDLSVLYFKQPENKISTPAAFSLNLAAQGRIAVDRPVLSGSTLTVDHPLLGEVTVLKEALISLLAAPLPDSEN